MSRSSGFLLPRATHALVGHPGLGNSRHLRVEEHPLRERLHGLYMLALFRAGRRNDALQVFHDLRARLGDYLGVDPGRALNELYVSLLRQEPEPTSLPQVADGPRNNLPSLPVALIGREPESSCLSEVLSDPRGARLVTLTGPGGVGETSLAVSVARSMTGEFPDGTWIVEVAGMDREATAADLAERVIATPGLCEGVPDSAFDLVEWLREALVEWRTLLLLDNCEHVVAQVTDLAGALSAVDRVRLFVEWARAASPELVLTAWIAPDVDTICRRLDGIPMAIELVAARLRALTTEQIATGLDDRFALPTGTGRGRLTRQQTLRSMIDWSWNLLTDGERSLLRRLAVHRDGCTLDGAPAPRGRHRGRAGSSAALVRGGDLY